MNERRAKGCLLAALIWCVILLVLGLAYRFLVHPRVADRIRHATGSPSQYQHELTIAADSFSGYCLLRSDTLQQDLKDQRIRVIIQDDQADYAARLEALRSGRIQMAAFTIDSLLAAGAPGGDVPGSIILVLDESQGADAIVARQSALGSLQDLDDPAARIVFTPRSPSEFLARIVLAHFLLPQLSEHWQEPAAGPAAVVERFRATGPQERKAFVLWEPELSRVLQEPGAQVLFDSAKLRGFIVDVLVARRQFLVEQPALARTFVEAYARTAYHYARKPEGLVDLVMTDARRTGAGTLDRAQARRLADGIRWKSLLDNYAHFGLAQGVEAGGVPTLEDMIANILEVLLKTRALTADPFAGRHTTLFYDRILADMRADRFHPGQALTLVPDLGPESPGEGSAAPSAPAPLTAEQWESLRPVGELRSPPIEFRRASAILSLDGERTLQDLARRLPSFPQLYLRVVGQARPEGDPEANRRLAQARADAVVEFLTRQGIPSTRVRAETSLPTGRGAEAQSVALMVGQLPY